MKPTNKDNPSSIFYWKDYENDEGLRISSLAAQGLWMRLLCVAAKAEPYGYILVNGFPLEATGAARLAGVTEGEAQSLLQELERNGVFSRDRKGRMFSRRMVRDAAMRAKAQKNGAKGGNPALSASVGNEMKKRKSDNPPVKPPLKPPYPLSHVPKNSVPNGTAKSAVSHPDFEAEDPDAWRAEVAAQEQSQPVDLDPVRELFETGIRILSSCGIAPPKARALVGKWRKDYPQQDPAILAAICAFQKSGAVDPVPWITAKLTPKPHVPTIAEIMARI